ncbi:MAG: tryptophan synthase subunit alpha [Candidatus Omnitrophica bacterium]|nr:tryptophan synthase subunit alpha [Candidatus Omnitrophota bacterium]
MNRINALFKRLKEERKKAFIVYITAGDPNLETTKKLIKELEKNGVDLIELGVPFSDPMADGPTIQRASQRALSGGTSIKSIFEAVHSVRKSVKLPLVFMTYYNPVLSYGPEKFVHDCKTAGVDGVIIPDLPPEEGKALADLSAKQDFSIIFLAAPTSSAKRLKIIAKKSSGFIYYVSLTGVTGERRNLAPDTVSSIRKLKKITKKPVCVGFGISRPSQAQRLSRIADGVIVGSAIINIIERNKGKKDFYKNVNRFTKSFERAVHKR